MKRFGIALLCAVAGYLVVAVASYFLVLQLSSNADRTVEAAMTSVFFFGPMGAVIVFIVAFALARRRSGAAAPGS